MQSLTNPPSKFRICGVLVGSTPVIKVQRGKGLGLILLWRSWLGHSGVTWCLHLGNASARWPPFLFFLIRPGLLVLPHTGPGHIGRGLGQSFSLVYSQSNSTDKMGRLFHTARMGPYWCASSPWPVLGSWAWSGVREWLRAAGTYGGQFRACPHSRDNKTCLLWKRA